MTPVTHLRVEDVRSLFRIVGEAREIRTANCDSTSHVLERLAVLTASDVAVDFACRSVEGAQFQLLGCHDYGWPNERDRDRFSNYYLTKTVDSDPLMAEATRRAGPIATVARAEILTQCEWRKTELFNEIYVPARLDASIIAFVRSGRDFRTLVFKRALRRPTYSARERELLDLFMHQLEWLEWRNDPEPSDLTIRMRELSPRERQVLEHLLTGASEKQIAAAVGVSHHTTHQYVKSIYRKLRVTSRAELMATCR